MGVIDVTTGPWYVDLGVIAGALTACVTVYRYGVAPVGRAMWAAIVAAPKIAESARELVDLLDGKVLDRLDAGGRRFEAIESEQIAIRQVVVDHEGRIKTLETTR